MMRKMLLAAAAGVCLGLAGNAQAAESDSELAKQDWSFSGIFGTYDPSALKRGFQVYNEVCSSCHSLEHVAYRNLGAVGFGEDEIKAIAADKEVPGAPDEDGEPTTRPARPADKFVPPFANERAARASNNGALPPDLSLMTKAREGGADYVYALLTGYEEPPKDVELGEGMAYNTVFLGRQIAMAQPLDDEAVDYTDGTKATIEQMSADVTTFLHWAAEPELNERKRLGVKVVLFLVFLTALLYAIKRKVWSELH